MPSEYWSITPSSKYVTSSATTNVSLGSTEPTNFNLVSAAIVMFALNPIDSLLDAIDDIVGLLELPVPNTSSPTLSYCLLQLRMSL